MREPIIGEGGLYNIKMSKIQAYKYSFIRRPAPNHALASRHEDATTVLRQKLDYANRIVPSALLKPSEKTLGEQEKGEVRGVREGRQEEKQEGEQERRTVDVQQQYLGQLVDLMGVVMRHGPALEEYLRLQSNGGENSGRNLEKEYQSAKERLQGHRGNRPTAQFALLKRTVINPERDHHHKQHHTHLHKLTIKRAFDLKLPPNPLPVTLHPPNSNSSRTSVEKQRRGSTGMPSTSEVGFSGQMQAVAEKYRHSQERVRMLEEALREETAKREELIGELNERVVAGEMALLNAKMRMRSSCLYP